MLVNFNFHTTNKTLFARTRAVAPFSPARSRIVPAQDYFFRSSKAKFNPKADWTPRSLLAWTSSHLSQTNPYRHRLAAEMYVANALGIARLDLYLRSDRSIEARKLSRYEKGLARLDAGEPLALLTGTMTFHDIVLSVGPRTFIPKPETENLVEAAIEVLRFLNTKTPIKPSLKVLDLCTGVGNIPIALLRSLPDFQLEVNGTDISSAALRVAEQNSRRAGYESQIHFFQGNLFRCPDLIPELYDVIVSNPPYKTTADARKSAQGSEPIAGFDGGKDGLDYIRKILAEAPTYLKPNGFLLLEVGEGQESDVLELCRHNPFWKVQRILDKSRGASSVLVASPQEQLPSQMAGTKRTTSTPLIQEKGNWFGAKVLRVLARDLAARIIELQAVLPQARKIDETKLAGKLSDKIETLIRDAGLQIQSERQNGPMSNGFEIMRLHLQAIEICDLLDPVDSAHGRQRHLSKYFNLTFLRKKEHQFGTIFDFAAIFILMDVLEPLITQLNREITRISRSPTRALFNLEELRELTRRATNCIDISKSFTAKKRNKYGERLSHTVPSNWSNVLYGLGICISQIEEKIATLKKIKIEGT